MKPIIQSTNSTSAATDKVRHWPSLRLSSVRLLEVTHRFLGVRPRNNGQQTSLWNHLFSRWTCAKNSLWTWHNSPSRTTPKKVQHLVAVTSALWTTVISNALMRSFQSAITTASIYVEQRPALLSQVIQKDSSWSRNGRCSNWHSNDFSSIKPSELILSIKWKRILSQKALVLVMPCLLSKFCRISMQWLMMFHLRRLFLLLLW